MMRRPEELLPERNAMKNPLDSLGQTIALGVVLTIVMTVLIFAIAGA
jgi:hypothetical protein